MSNHAVDPKLKTLEALEAYYYYYQNMDYRRTRRG